MENIFKVGSNKEKSVIRVVDTKHLLQYARCQRYIILILTNYEEGAIFFFYILQLRRPKLRNVKRFSLRLTTTIKQQNLDSRSSLTQKLMFSP